MSYRTKSFMMLRKLQRAHPTSCGHFAHAYLVGSNMLRAYLFFIYGLYQLNAICTGSYPEQRPQADPVDLLPARHHRLRHTQHPQDHQQL